MSSAALALLLPLSASAEWKLIDDFENGMDKVVAADDSNPYYIMEIVDDPVVAGNHGITIDPNSYGTLWGGVYASIALTADQIPPTVGTYTFYSRVLRDGGASSEVVWGLVDVPVTIDEETGKALSPKAYADYEVCVALGALGDTGDFRIRDGSAWTYTDEPTALDEWMEVWCVVTAVVDDADNGIVDTYKTYVRHPGEETAHLVPVPILSSGQPTGETKESASLRNGGDNPMTAFTFATYAGDPAAPFLGDPWILDDIYLTEGAVTTAPGETMVTPKWADWPLQSDTQWVNTGDFLGYLWVGNKPWIWSTSLNRYIWLRESDVQASGAWTYLTGGAVTTTGDTVAAAKWAGWPLQGDTQWVNTGDYLGHLWVGNKPWIWSASLDKYIWLRESDVQAGGAWTYVIR